MIQIPVTKSILEEKILTIYCWEFFLRQSFGFAKRIAVELHMINLSVFFYFYFHLHAPKAASRYRLNNIFSMLHSFNMSIVNRKHKSINSQVYLWKYLEIT